VDWLNQKLRVERAIVHQRVDDVKTIYSQKMMSVDSEILCGAKSLETNNRVLGG